MPLYWNIVIRDNLKSLCNFWCKIMSKLQVFVNKGKLRWLMLTFEYQKRVIFKKIWVFLSDFISIFQYFLKIILMFVQKLYGLLISLTNELRLPIMYRCDNLISYFLVQSQMIDQLNQSPIIFSFHCSTLKDKAVALALYLLLIIRPGQTYSTLILVENVYISFDDIEWALSGL